MYIEKLGITPEQQSQVDEIFLDTTLNALNQQDGYTARAWLVTKGNGELAAELEAIQRRTHDKAHEALISDGEITPTVIRLMGKLAFIDCLALPTSDFFPLKSKVEVVRAVEPWNDRRRLFTESPSKEK